MMRPFKGVRKTESPLLPAVAQVGSAVLSRGIPVNFASGSPVRWLPGVRASSAGNG